MKEKHNTMKKSEQMSLKLLITASILFFAMNLMGFGFLEMEKKYQMDEDVKYFEYADFPKIEYFRPDIEVWIEQLKPLKSDNKSLNYIKIVFQKNRIKYIELVQDGIKDTNNIKNNVEDVYMVTFLRKETYTIYEDSIKFEFIGLSVSQPGYTLYAFESELLNKKTTYVACMATVFCKFEEFHFEYWQNTSKPKHIYKYFYMKEFAGCGENYIETYDEHGKLVEKKEIK